MQADSPEEAEQRAGQEVTAPATKEAALAEARALLAAPTPRERVWPVLAAATFAAVAALALAGAMITAPPVVTQHVVGPEAAP